MSAFFLLVTEDTIGDKFRDLCRGGVVCKKDTDVVPRPGPNALGDLTNVDLVPLDRWREVERRQSLLVKPVVIPIK